MNYKRGWLFEDGKLVPILYGDALKKKPKREGKILRRTRNVIPRQFVSRNTRRNG